MNTMTMANALKAVFGAQTLTTASYFPACAQDGTPSGVISAANLASVLGAKPIPYDGNGVENGMPKDNGAYFKAGVGSGVYKIHLFRAASKDGGLLYHQLTSGETPSGSAWVPVYDTSLLTNSDLLSPLASALGDTKAFYYEPELISNANTSFKGIRRTNPSTTGATTYGVIISYLAAGDLLQLWITNGDGVKYRCCTGATSFPQWTSL